MGTCDIPAPLMGQTVAIGRFRVKPLANAKTILENQYVTGFQPQLGV
jgi:hypothetical protein